MGEVICAVLLERMATLDKGHSAETHGKAAVMVVQGKKDMLKACIHHTEQERMLCLMT